MKSTLTWSALSVVCAILAQCLSAAEVVPKTKVIHLVVVAGQSNCAGYDTHAEDLVPSTIDQSIPFMFDVGRDPEYDNGFHNASSYGHWTTLRTQPNGVPLFNDGKISGYAFRTATGGFGPEIGIARTLYEHGITNLAVFKFAFGASGFKQKNWNPGDSLNKAFMTRYDQAVAQLQERGYTVRVKAVFWHQGENDSGNPEYPNQFLAFVLDVRKTWGAAELPFITAVSTPDYWVWKGEVTDKERKERNQGVGAVHAAIAKLDKDIHYVDDRGCERSVLCGHYSSQGALEIGARMAAMYLEKYGAADADHKANKEAAGTGPPPGGSPAGQP